MIYTLVRVTDAIPFIYVGDAQAHVHKYMLKTQILYSCIPKNNSAYNIRTSSVKDALLDVKIEWYS